MIKYFGILAFFAAPCRESRVSDFVGDDKGYCRRPDLEDGIINIDIGMLRLWFYTHKKDNNIHFYAHKSVTCWLLGLYCDPH